ncbi:SH3 domain-containing protein [Fischerella thermalis]|uniref:Peptide-binding protein n=1 Tax=Fischerella thermalis CCMEE 5318 TaxID=2019666 RepID=A0A2N6LG27_9CYAN|nr:SH3 domain-containing protein [Fischerella thermalis]PMB22667.1 peptide-binding protein [Fischerella thermalis CCMEE 5318]
MKSHKLMVGAVVVAIATTLTYFPVKAQTVCKVTDPTGTPLNVRKSPNGQIIGTIENYTEVDIYEIVRDEKNRPWAKVGFEGRVWGWVFREFISCYQN